MTTTTTATIHSNNIATTNLTTSLMDQRANHPLTRVFRTLSLLLLLQVTSSSNQFLTDSTVADSNIDLVDLIEHGKTFAYIKLKLHVQASHRLSPVSSQKRSTYLRAISGKPVFTSVQSALSPRGSIDPLEEVASGLKVSLSSLNKTLVDCFFVDLDKRYSQRLDLEDKYRLITSTRRVSFAHMMRALTECQLLALANPPAASTDLDKINHVNNTTIPAEREDEKSSSSSNNHEPHRLVSTSNSESHPSDLFGALFSSWMRPAPPTTLAVSGTEQQTELTVSSSNSALPYKALSSNEVPEVGERQQTFLNLGLSMVSGIVPNTLWCGLGDRATNYTELGNEYKVDSCCRAHDHCSVRIKPFSTDYGLVNWSVSTRSHCACDLAFNNCLTQVNSTLANVIKTLYFRLVGLQCINVADVRQYKRPDIAPPQTTTTTTIAPPIPA